MGIASSCFLLAPLPVVKLIYWGGKVQLLPSGGSHLAGEIMFDHPGTIVCDADSFYIGHPVPALSLGDELLAGCTYFVLPVGCIPGTNLTTAALACLSSHRHKPNLAASLPFEYVKGSDGRMLIKVMPEFITKVISAEKEEEGGDDEGERGALTAGGGELCSTPELRKHYAQLVGSSRERPWSPKLETITEKKPRTSPVRLLGFDQRR